MYPHLQAMHKEAETLDLTEDLMSLDMGTLYRQVGGMDAGKGAFGWIPTMASSSVGQLGALSAESYCDRILSCANNVLTKGNTLLSDAELEMIVVLRMNREFMQFMREHYGRRSRFSGRQLFATSRRAGARFYLLVQFCRLGCAHLGPQ